MACGEGGEGMGPNAALLTAGWVRATPLNKWNGSAAMAACAKFVFQDAPGNTKGRAQARKGRVKR